MKYDQEKYNPCLKEQQITYKCFDKFNYDKEKCELEIYNYKECKSFWHRVKGDRKRKGIKPYLPDPEEREQIKLQYMKSKPT
ncbi:hypothetical protein RI129_002234 [Pyrocoelia pectoralis]|uniref:Coiled-coil-helix-coiled-coil-helix domain-containing protein 7 n=1 Tax=Pyrocoelia pectoralis TaxID=417401 RepID=A0AAN7ZKW1_9COLE